MKFLKAPAIQIACIFIASLAFAECGGTERWGVKDGTDPDASHVDLSNITPISIDDLIHNQEPHLPPVGDNETRLPQETHVYRVQARLVKWKEEAGETGDSDFHLVLTDDTLKYTKPHENPTGHSFIGEIPDPDCLAGAHGNFGTSSPFLPVSSNTPLGIAGARNAIKAQFPDAVFDGGWNEAGGIPVEIVGVGYFDPPHGQVGRAPNNIEIHPILSITFPEQNDFLLAHAATPPVVTAHAAAAATPQAGAIAAVWQYTLISSDSADKLLASANALGAQGWEMVSVAVDTNRPDRYVGYLKRRVK